MLLAAKMMCAKGKIVFTGARGVEGTKAEGIGVGTTQNIQENKRIEQAYFRFVDSNKQTYPCRLNKVRLVRSFGALQKLIRTSLSAG